MSLGCSDKKGNFSEKNISDSLSIYLTLANEDTISYDQRLEYNNKAFDILKDQENDTLNRKNLFKVANRYFNINNLESYKKAAEIVSERSKQSNDTISIAKAYSYLGDYYTNTSEKDSAFLFYTKAEKIYQKLDDQSNLATIYISIATLQTYEKDYVNSEMSAIKALNILKFAGDKSKMYEANNILGYISYKLKDFEKSLEYHTKAYVLATENDLNQSHEATNSLNNIGNIYQNLDQDKIAIDKFELALKDKTLFADNPKLYATLLDNLAYSKFKLKNYSELPGLFYKSLKIRDSLDITSGIIYNKIHLSEYFAKIKDTASALKVSKEAYELSKTAKNPQDILLTLKQLGIVEPANASFYSGEYIKINDSLQQAERKSKDKFARISFETDEYIMQNDKLAEQNRKIIFSGIIIILFGTLIFVIKNQQSRNKEFLLKQAQQKANEDIYDLLLFQQQKIEEGRADEKVRIAQELHDGILGRLFGARLNLDSLNKRQDEDAMVSRNNFIAELKSIEQDIREISHDLSREKDEVNNNFIGIFTNLIEQQENLSDAKVYCSISPDIHWDKIENNIKINLYRILQESLQNINKYAQASTIKIEISKAENNLKTSISDNGIGFQVSKKSKGIGLKNIISRTQSCNGTLDIQSKIGAGTSIVINLPINQ